MRKKIFLLISLIGIILLIFGIVLSITKEDSKKIENNKVVLSIVEEKKIQYCIEKEDCLIQSEEIFKIISIDTDIDVIKEKVDKINQDTEKYYNESNSSTVDDNSCVEVAKYLNHSYRVISDIYVYSDDDIISFSVSRSTINYCSNEENILPFESYTYDLEKEKFLTNDDIIEREKIETKTVEDTVALAISQYNEAFDTNYEFIDVVMEGESGYKLFYDYSGSLLVNFYHTEANEYFTSIVINRIDY